MVVGINLLLASSVERYTFRVGATKVTLDNPTIESYLKELIFPELEPDRDEALSIVKT